MKLTLIVVWTLLSGWLSGCAPVAVTRREWHPSKGVEALLRSSVESLQRVDDLSAEAKMRIRGPEGSGSATALILYKRPDLFRVDIRGPLFSHVLTALVDGDSLTVIVHGQTLKGPADGGLLRHLTQVDLGGYSIAHVLLGVVEPARQLPGSLPEYNRADRVGVALEHGAFQRRISVDLYRGFVFREEVISDGELVWRRALSGYRLVGPTDGDLYLPGQIRLDQGQTSVELNYRSWAVNRGIDDSALRRGIPTN